MVASPTWKISDSWNSRFACVRVDEASARASEDSVPHFAAEKPDQAARIVTIERRSASPMAIARSRPSCPRECLACAPISLPTSVAESPSDTG